MNSTTKKHKLYLAAFEDQIKIFGKS